MSRRIDIILAVVGCLSFQTAAEVIVATNFDGRTLTTTTTTNDSATDLEWVVNGVADPGDLTAVPDVAAGNGFGEFEANGLFETAAAAHAFVPNLNIHNEGTYFVDVPITPLGQVREGLSFEFPPRPFRPRPPWRGTSRSRWNPGNDPRCHDASGPNDLEI